ncbi:MAG: patatin-like phospholipase family protein, partial [Dissulfurispiraceae bacterium]
MQFRSTVIVLFVLMLNVMSCAPVKEAVVQPPLQKPARVAVVLGAGASRGFAHIGVLKVLESNNIPINMVVGTSAGSFVGSLYSYGYNAYQLQKMAIDLQKSDIIDPGMPDNGFIKGELLEAYVNKAIKNTPIEKLRIPFYAVATDIQTGQEIVFGSGNTGTAVRASCSIPGVFRPVRIGSRMYVDGGVVSPVAVDTARKMGADIVIAVDISSDLGTTLPEGTMDTILQSVNIMYSKLSYMQLSGADIVIRPKVGRIGSNDFDKRHEAILEGEKAALEAL